MNQIEIFNSPEFGSIRTLEQNGKVLFCGTDVATALGYTNPRKAVRDHTRGGTKCSIGVQTGKKADGSPAVQMVEMLFIPEGDLYRLIAHSKLPSAERFEQWVFDEVLPAIRKHGAYLTKEKLWEIATSPEALIKLCSELLAEREENASLREENALLESKAAFYDLFIDLNHRTNRRTTAKITLQPPPPPPKSCLSRSVGLSVSFWKSVLCTAPHPVMYCPMQSQPMKDCFVSKTTAITGISAPIR